MNDVEPLHCQKCGKRLADRFIPLKFYTMDAGRPVYYVRSTCPDFKYRFFLFGNGHDSFDRKSYYAGDYGGDGILQLFYQDGTQVK
jgi:hypothetical protein